jgi:hypothetical protein
MNPHPVLHHDEIDGVRVLRLDTPGPLSASLVFRAGTATATFRTQPVPHLLEHLVISALPRTRHSVNGSTTAEDLSFDVSGTPAQVRETLHGICAAIRDLPLDRLAHDARVVDIEQDGSGHSLCGLHTGLRCGMDGAGLEGRRDVPAAQVTAEQVRDFAARRLVRGNAVLVLTGPVPEGLRLDLPDGPLTVLDSAVRTDVQLPALLRVDAPLTAMSVRTSASPAAALMARLLQERAEASLRHELGVVYSVESEVLLLGPDRVMRLIAADGAESAAQIAARLLDVLRELAEGPTSQELAADLEDLETLLADPRTHEDLLFQQAHRLLSGLPVHSGEQLLEDVRTVTPGQVQECARRALGTVLVTVPAEAEVNAATLRIQDLTDDAWERDPEVAGTVHGRRLLSFAPHNLRVVHGEEGLTVRAHGCTATFPSDQVVGILRSGPWLEVLRRDGRSLAFRPRDVRRGKELESAILERWGSLLVLDEVTSD